jgi:hypothetical protein
MMARNGTMEDSGFLNNRRHLLHDRDRKSCPGFREVIRAEGIEPPLTRRSPASSISQSAQAAVPTLYGVRRYSVASPMMFERVG